MIFRWWEVIWSLPPVKSSLPIKKTNKQKQKTNHQVKKTIPLCSRLTFALCKLNVVCKKLLLYNQMIFFEGVFTSSFPGFSAHTQMGRSQGALTHGYQATTTTSAAWSQQLAAPLSLLSQSSLLVVTLHCQDSSSKCRWKLPTFVTPGCEWWAGKVAWRTFWVPSTVCF